MKNIIMGLVIICLILWLFAGLIISIIVSSWIATVIGMTGIVWWAGTILFTAILVAIQNIITIQTRK
jgi:hypothetical protein